MIFTEGRFKASVLMPLNAGYTRVLVHDAPGYLSPVPREIPTAPIPPHLRKIGSYFMVTERGIRHESGDSAEDLRDAVRECISSLTVEEMAE